MDLEIADYERTVHALTQQLEQRDSQVADLKSEMKGWEERVQLMKSQLGMTLYLCAGLS